MKAKQQPRGGRAIPGSSAHGRDDTLPQQRNTRYFQLSVTDALKHFEGLGEHFLREA